jgi:hypothetical protein
MKSGMAKKGKVSIPEYSFKVTVDTGMAPCQRRARMHARVMENATGTFMTSKIPKVARRTRTVPMR